LNLTGTTLACAAALLWHSAAHAQQITLEDEIAQLVTTAKPAARKVGGIQAAGAPANAASTEGSRLRVADDGFVRFLGAAPDHHFPVDIANVAAGQPEVTGRNFLKKNAKLFGAASRSVDFRHQKTRAKALRRHMKYQQTYADIPVFAAQVNVQLNDEDGVESVISDIQRDTKILDDGALSTRPQLTGLAADAAVRAALAAQHPGARVQLSNPALMLFAPEVIGATGPIRLVWEMTAISDDADIDDRFLVDAHNGSIVRKLRLGCTAMNRQIYDANSSTADPGTLRRSEGGAASGIADVNSAYTFLGNTYNFYLNNHGRDGINGSGGVMSATVRVCTSDDCPWSNAQYRSNGRMYFGVGFATDDVAGHELTHGVTGNESGLIYENASGAINESFSDVWGEFVDLGNGTGDDSAAVRWLMGEDLPNGSIRSMRDPASRSDADRRNSPLYKPAEANPDKDNDFGGVHSNSGVNNKLAFLLTDGDTFNGYTIRGHGIARVADLYYEVQTDLLTPGSDWDDLYEALMQASVNLGWNNDDRNNLYRACRAVEIAGGARNVYVDGTSGCLFQTGAQNCGLFSGPFHTVLGGNTAVWPGDNLWIRGTSYDEAVTFSKIMLIRSYNGTATIGQ